MTTHASPWLPRERFGNALALSAPGTGPEPPARLRELLERIPPEVVERFTGCGSPIPEAIEGRRVLDLGCGTGRDVFLCAALAGPTGFVMGLDRDRENLEVARRSVEAAMRAFGHPEPNVAFRWGNIENLEEAELEDEGFDVVISNRAVNLAPQLKVLREVYRVLRPGGEFYFADVYTNRRLPAEVAADQELVRDHLGGAAYVNDFLRLARKAGFVDPRVVGRYRLHLADLGLEARMGGVEFWAYTFRLFKVADLEDGEEDYGQAARYLGSIPGCAHHFVLDADHRFETGRAVPVGGNTARILGRSRFSRHFDLIGDFSRHYGPFRPRP